MDGQLIVMTTFLVMTILLWLFVRREDRLRRAHRK